MKTSEEARSSRGTWLVRRDGNIVQIPIDPGIETYFDPPTLPEKEPGAPFKVLRDAEAYRRFTLLDGGRVVAVYYAASELAPTDRLRLSNAVYSSYGRD